MLTETQKKACEGATWKLVVHMNCEDKGVLVHHCEKLNICREIITPKTNGEWGKGVATFYFNGGNTGYGSLPEVLASMGIN